MAALPVGRQPTFVASDLNEAADLLISSFASKARG